MTVAAGVALAAAAWAFMFLPDWRGFWGRAAVAGLAIGGYAAVAQRDRWDQLLDAAAADVVLGVVTAAALYWIFFAGDRILRRWLPSTAAHVDDLYLVRSVRGSGPLPVSAVVVLVGCCEELFWRGFVQERGGFAVALAAYAAVHVWERKPILVLAAVVGGVWWGALFAWRGSLVAPLVSHALWDLAVVVWFPFTPEKARR